MAVELHKQLICAVSHKRIVGHHHHEYKQHLAIIASDLDILYFLVSGQYVQMGLIY